MGDRYVSQTKAAPQDFRANFLIDSAAWREALQLGVTLLEARLLAERRAALAAYAVAPGEAGKGARSGGARPRILADDASAPRA